MAEQVESVVPSNVIAWTSAAIGVVSGLAAGTLGYENAKDVYQAANHGTAGLSDYITVGKAFWDAVPIAAIFAVTCGMLVYGVYLNPAYWRSGAGLVMLGAGYFGSQVDAPRHLQAYEAVVRSGAHDSAGMLTAFVLAYGLLASILAAIAGVGVGVAIGTWAKENSG